MISNNNNNIYFINYIFNRILSYDSSHIPIPDDAETVQYYPSDVESIYTLDSIDDTDTVKSNATSLYSSSKVDGLTIASSSSGANYDTELESNNSDEEIESNHSDIEIESDNQTLV